MPPKCGFAFFGEEIGIAYPWRPWRYGGSIVIFRRKAVIAGLAMGADAHSRLP